LLRAAPLTRGLAAGVVGLRLTDQMLVLLNFLVRLTSPRLMHRGQEGGEKADKRAGMTEQRTMRVLIARVEALRSNCWTSDSEISALIVRKK
jgi:hypothetical protein